MKGVTSISYNLLSSSYITFLMVEDEIDSVFILMTGV